MCWYIRSCLLYYKQINDLSAGEGGGWDTTDSLISAGNEFPPLWQLTRVKKQASCLVPWCVDTYSRLGPGRERGEGAGSEQVTNCHKDVIKAAFRELIMGGPLCCRCGAHAPRDVFCFSRLICNVGASFREIRAVPHSTLASPYRRPFFLSSLYTGLSTRHQLYYLNV